MTRRPCCIDGKRHTVLCRRRYAYVTDATPNGPPAPYRVRRVAHGRPEDHVVLCSCGRWAIQDTNSSPWQFQSARAADDMARRLNAGLPVHRDRWLGAGAILLLSFEFLQAFKWW